MRREQCKFKMVNFFGYVPLVAMVLRWRNTTSRKLKELWYVCQTRFGGRSKSCINNQMQMHNYLHDPCLMNSISGKTLSTNSAFEREMCISKLMASLLHHIVYFKRPKKFNMLLCFICWKRENTEQFCVKFHTYSVVDGSNRK